MKRKKSAMTRNLRFVSALDGRTPGAGVEHLERLGTLARLNVRSRRLPFPPCRNPWLNALVPPRRPPCRRSARFSCFSEPAERAVVPASADSSVSERKRSAPGAGSDPEPSAAALSASRNWHREPRGVVDGVCGSRREARFRGQTPTVPSGQLSATTRRRIDSACANERRGRQTLEPQRASAAPETRAPSRRPQGGVR